MKKYIHVHRRSINMNNLTSTVAILLNEQHGSLPLYFLGIEAIKFSQKHVSINFIIGERGSNSVEGFLIHNGHNFSIAHTCTQAI